MGLRLMAGKHTRKRTQAWPSSILRKCQRRVGRCIRRAWQSLLPRGGVDKDIQRAADLLRRAAEKDGEANYHLCLLYETGEIGFIDLDKAIQYYRQADASARPDANLRLGRLLFMRGQESDIAEAPDFIRKAADAGIVDAHFQYARLLDKGENVSSDANLAAVYYKQAAEAGILQAQLRLAELYKGERGVAIDPEASFTWYLAAAEQGDASAAYAVGDAYLTGKGVKANRQQAAFWFEAAALADFEDAAWRLVQLMRSDINAASGKNPAKTNSAYPDYLKLAADKNNPEAALLFAQFILQKGVSDDAARQALPILQMQLRLALQRPCLRWPYY